MKKQATAYSAVVFSLNESWSGLVQHIVACAGTCPVTPPPGADLDTDILKGGAKNNNRAQNARKFRPRHTKRPRSSTMAAERPVYEIFGVFLQSIS